MGNRSSLADFSGEDFGVMPEMGIICQAALEANRGRSPGYQAHHKIDLACFLHGVLVGCVWQFSHFFSCDGKVHLLRDAIQKWAAYFGWIASPGDSCVTPAPAEQQTSSYSVASARRRSSRARAGVVEWRKSSGGWTGGQDPLDHRGHRSHRSQGIVAGLGPRRGVLFKRKLLSAGHL